MYTREDPPMREKKSKNANMMRLSEQSLELVSVFKKASETSNLFFAKEGKKFKKPFPHSQKVVI
jgi:hypothetical protein